MNQPVKILARLVDTGITNYTPPELVKCIKFCNIWALALIPTYLFYVFFGVYLDNVTLVIASCIAISSSITTVVLNGCHRFNIARVVFILVPNLYVLFCSFYFSRDLMIYLFFLVSIIGTPLQFPLKSIAAIVISTMFIGACLYASLFVAPFFPPTVELNEFQTQLGRQTVIIGTTICLLAFGVAVRYILRNTDKSTEMEQQKSEMLLRNILPEEIIPRLKDDEGKVVDSFEEVTVLFADIVNFTGLTSGMSPNELVNFLNKIFSLLDNIAVQYDLEKIKTVGSSYMVAAGVPVPRKDHVESTIEMALDMRSAVKRIPAPGGAPIMLRMGINTGPAIAGVIGSRKFIYDLWGDTVNTASRMESDGVDGEIQVTEAVYRKMADRYRFEYRGDVEIKGKGWMPLWILKDRLC